MAARAAGTLIERLRARRSEIEQTTLTRVYSVDDPTAAGDPEYVAGLRAAVSAALSYALAGIEEGRAEPGPVPLELLAQARYAARNGVSLATVLRRYFAGYTLLEGFVMQEAEDSELLGSEKFQQMTRTQAALFDRLVAAVTEEHGRELRKRSHTAKQRRVECVERLLAGELADTSELAYELDAHHLGVIAAGPGGTQAVKDLAGALDRRLLLVQPGGSLTWAWLGGGRRVEAEDLGRLAERPLRPEVALAIGEPAQGFAGWRFTHRQALAVLPIAQCRPGRAARYVDFALLAAMTRDEALVHFLHQTYLAPLAPEPDGGAILFRTLRAYYAAERHVSSAATALGLSRNTVASRLKVAEDRVERPLATCVAEMEAALRLEELESWSQ